MSSQNDFHEQFRSAILTEIESAYKETWLAKFARHESFEGAEGYLKSSLSGTPITFVAAPESYITFCGRDEVDFIASPSSSRPINEKLDVAHREKFVVDAGCLQTRPFEGNINQQDPQAADGSLRGFVRDFICLQDAMVQATMLGICRGKSDYQMAMRLIDRPGTMQEFSQKPGTTLAEKAQSPFISIVNDLTKNRNSRQRIRPVSRMFVTGSPANNVNFYKYKEPPASDIAIPTSADNAINALTGADDLLTWDVLCKIMASIYRGAFNCGAYKFEKSQIAKQFVKRLDDCEFFQNRNIRYITVVVNRETMKDLMGDKKGQIDFVAAESEWKKRFHNEDMVILNKLGFRFCLMVCDNLPVYENAEGHRVGVAAILGKGALAVLHNDRGTQPVHNGSEEPMAGIEVVEDGRLRCLFGCARPDFNSREDKNYLTDYGSIMLIHHGMRK